ncbi:cell division protein FtsL [Craterilacuibacter sinensis]|uniref:Cell division protein FtsL n=1 Tax=Craterilacuibacter sinensis TaxID=2686017 RepID=A0A845BPR1_9NEIS|nr:cell division protein FtsL [Craterilacuibacter sinensis]MXR36461.1 cell division protein FtsL [Craterilacuibacter sinensis]RQW28517.1 cell division protein FtsL [Rhodobacteraceae bacterium CH30]
MNRLNAILLMVLVACAMSVVSSQHMARKLYSELEKEQKQTKMYGVEYGQLLLEQSTWGAQALIEKVSSERLGMHAPEPREIQVVFGKGGQ